jgi:hypothetical protein
MRYIILYVEQCSVCYATCMFHIMLCCILSNVLHCTVLHCTVLHCIVLLRSYCNASYLYRVRHSWWPYVSTSNLQNVQMALFVSHHDVWKSTDTRGFTMYCYNVVRVRVILRSLCVWLWIICSCLYAFFIMQILCHVLFMTCSHSFCSLMVHSKTFLYMSVRTPSTMCNALVRLCTI